MLCCANAAMLRVKTVVKDDYDGNDDADDADDDVDEVEEN